MKIAFVSYGRFDSNSGGHVAGFANRLAARGHAVAVFADGDPAGAADFGPVAFHAAPRTVLEREPARALAFDGRPAALSDTLLHGWTPRESVRAALSAARRLAPFATLIHLEDDERLLAAASLGRPWEALKAMSPAALDPLVAPSLVHPHRLERILAGADAVTAIAEPLFALAGRPGLLLRPGVEPPAPPPDPTRLRAHLGVEPRTRLIVYPGNLHPANRAEMLSLYVAAMLLRRRGLNVVLVRTGEDFGEPADVAYGHLRGEVSVELGRRPRAEVLALVTGGDVLIQPGPADAVNRSRLPSKLPEFFAAGRPVILPAANLGLEVEDGVEAVVSRIGDGSELADLAQGLLADRERAQAIGEAGRAFIRRVLDWDRSAGALEALYAEVLGRKRGAARAAA
jgi:glycosyltransferase involved in cell wall biosynthesis